MRIPDLILHGIEVESNMLQGIGRSPSVESPMVRSPRVEVLLKLFAMGKYLTGYV